MDALKQAEKITEIVSRGRNRKYYTVFGVHPFMAALPQPIVSDAV